MTMRALDLFAGLLSVDQCWTGLGWPNGNGYQRIEIDGERFYVHRLSYEYFIGPIPGGHMVDHLCRNRPCFNPLHLEAVTNEENIRRGELPHLAQVSLCEHGVQNWRAKCPPCRREWRILRGETKSRRGRPEDRTECPKGHPYDEENTYLVYRKDGSIKQRMCRECGRERVRARRARAKGSDAQ